jgi:hypothetical protein
MLPVVVRRCILFEQQDQTIKKHHTTYNRDATRSIPQVDKCSLEAIHHHTNYTLTSTIHYSRQQTLPITFKTQSINVKDQSDPDDCRKVQALHSIKIHRRIHIMHRTTHLNITKGAADDDDENENEN